MHVVVVFNRRADPALDKMTAAAFLGRCYNIAKKSRESGK